MHVNFYEVGIQVVRLCHACAYDRRGELEKRCDGGPGLTCEDCLHANPDTAPPVRQAAVHEVAPAREVPGLGRLTEWHSVRLARPLQAFPDAPVGADGPSRAHAEARLLSALAPYGVVELLI